MAPLVSVAALPSLHLSALLLDDIATHWGYVDKNPFYQRVADTYVGGMESISPGHLLHKHLIEWSFKHGLKFFDFGIGDRPIHNFRAY